VVVGSREWSRRCPELVQDGGEVVGVGGYSRIKFGNGDVSHLYLLASLFFICLEYFVERLFQDAVGYALLSMCDFQVAHTLLSPAMVNALFFSCSGGRCVKT
jgi:hypothetical protein